MVHRGHAGWRGGTWRRGRWGCMGGWRCARPPGAGLPGPRGTPRDGRPRRAGAAAWLTPRRAAGLEEGMGAWWRRCSGWRGSGSPAGLGRPEAGRAVVDSWWLSPVGVRRSRAMANGLAMPAGALVPLLTGLLPRPARLVLIWRSCTLQLRRKGRCCCCCCVCGASGRALNRRISPVAGCQNALLSDSSAGCCGPRGFGWPGQGAG